MARLIDKEALAAELLTIARELDATVKDSESLEHKGLMAGIMGCISVIKDTDEIVA